MSAPAGVGVGFGDSAYAMRYGGYEDPKSFEPYQLLLLGLDLVFNWVMDWAHTDPLAILVIFVFQCLGLIVSFIVYIMASASQAMQSGLRKSIVYHHQVNLLTWLVYLILTCSWYIWALRKSWPSVSDQFSFSFSSGSTVPSEEENDMLTINVTTIATTTTTTTSTISPLISTLVTQSLNKSRSIRRLLHPDYDSDKEGHGEFVKKGDKTVREFYTLWSSGFVALYVIQRTVAIIYYCVYLKASYLVLNASTIDKLNVSKYPNPDLADNSRKSKKFNPQGNGSNRRTRLESGEVVDEGDSDTSELADERDWRNFRNSFEISKERKPRGDSQSYLQQQQQQGVTTLSPNTSGNVGRRGGNYYYN